MAADKRLLPSLYLSGLKDLITGYGQDPGAIALAADVDPAVLGSPDHMLADHELNALLESAALACDDQFLLLKLAERQNWGMMAPVAQLLDDISSVGGALDRIVEYNNEHNPGLFCYLQNESGLTTLCFEIRAFSHFDPLQLRGQLHLVDHVMALFCYELRNQLGDHWHPRYALFQYAIPVETSPLHRLFGDRLYFDQDVNGLSLSKKDLAQPFTLERMGRMPQHHLTELPGSIPIELRVDRAIRLLINNGECSAQAVSSTLNINLRTLQYRLKQAGTSYQAQYNAVRLDLARSYLATSKLSISAIAERLQFNDSPAFANFFRQRAGCSPRQYRHQLRK